MRPKRRSDVPIWSKAVDQYRAHLIARRRSPHTITAYCADLADFASWYQDSREEPPQTRLLDESVLAAWMTYLEKIGRKPASINRKLAVLGSFAKWCRELGLADKFEMPEKAEEVTPPPKWLTRSEELLLVRTARDSGSTMKSLVVALGLNVGLRVAELADLKWSDIEMNKDRGTLTVRLGKGRKRRKVALNPDARAALWKFGYSKHAGQDAYVLKGQRGERSATGHMSAKGIQKMVEALGDKAGLKDFSTHVLRHTFCRRLREAGRSLEEIAGLAGHASLETTRRYVEPGEEDFQEAVDSLISKRAELDDDKGPKRRAR
jgi:site-specific recombinase XerD